MRIIYFTTASEKEDYISFCKNWQISLNTTIQNLHNRLIRSLALTQQVEVISVRPFSKKNCNLKMLPAFTTQEGNITWHYLQIKRNRLVRFISAKKQANKLLNKMNLEDCIILTDTLNPYILNSSTSLAVKYNLPIIGVCNNTPSGIHNTGRSYTMFLLNAAMDLSGYITLTSGLNELFNEHNRANMTFEGILEDSYKPVDVSKYGKYFFYNGNLEEKYGVYDLISAFKELKDPEIKLIISGYHADESRINKAIAGSNIINLGMINLDEIMSFENGSIANINPSAPSLSRAQIAAEIAGQVLKIFEEDASSPEAHKAIIKEYKEASFLLGRELTVFPLIGDEKSSYKANATDIDENAGLIVTLPDGTTKTLSSGEVTLKSSNY